MVRPNVVPPAGPAVAIIIDDLGYRIKRREVVDADARKGAFFMPTLLHCQKPLSAKAVHSVEAFWPGSTILPYDTLDEAIELARLGAGSLAGSIITNDNEVARELVLGTAAYHGRMVIINRHCAAESTGHGSPLAHLVHGGPGRAGGGEEMGGVRGIKHYMQRTALQGEAWAPAPPTSHGSAPRTHPRGF